MYLLRWRSDDTDPVLNAGLAVSQSHGSHIRKPATYFFGLVRVERLKSRKEPRIQKSFFCFFEKETGKKKLMDIFLMDAK